MLFHETAIPGAYLIEPERLADHRGFFARVWCKRELLQRGLLADLNQSNMSFSHHKGTLRGLHFQEPPHAEVKIIRCTRGQIYDVIVDLRPDSPTHKTWIGVHLTEENRAMLYVPEGCAQGFLTLTDGSEVYYHTSEFYYPELATGVRYDDPQFSIHWPIRVTVVSEQDTRWPDYSTQADMSRRILGDSR
jgi:dTDP-4-dehydrorhamnose 3,5-epimerase